MSWQQPYLDRFYSRSSGWIDGTTVFHDMCSSAIPVGGHILEVGAGPANETSTFLSSIGTVHGLDIDPDIKSNEALAAAHVFSGSEFPFPDSIFDACVTNYVNEHIADPIQHLQEVRRVLKPGGVYIFRTPNRFHYTALVSAVTPHWFHKLVANRLRNLPPGAHDPYPTCYKMNSRASIGSLADEARFEVADLRMIESEPSYGMYSRLLFFPFMVYERLVNSTDKLAGLRANIFGILKKHS